MNLKWSRIKAGHYYTYGRPWNSGSVFDIHIHLNERNWILTINGKRRGHFRRLSDAKTRADELLNPKNE